MYKRLLLFSSILLMSVLAYGQNPYVKTEVFLSNGDVLKGEVDSTFARKSNFKIFFEDDSHQLISRSDIDSIHCNGNRYIPYKIGWETAILRIIDEGKVDLNEMNGKHVALKREDTRLHPVFYKKYHRAYFVFCQDSIRVPKAKMSRTEFTEEVKNYNAIHRDTLAHSNYDWLKSHANPFILRLSVVMPSAGVEIKLTNNFSLYSGLAINFYGDAIRGAKLS